MGDVRHADGFFVVRPGLSLYHQEWTTANARVPLVILHGGGDHSGRHAETAGRLAREGYAVHVPDLPGHGRSPGKRGHIGRFEEYVASVRAFIEEVSRRFPGRKPVLLGHSLGGLVGTRYAIRHGETIRCLVLSSPLWGLNFRVPLWQRFLARLLLPIWPSFTMNRPQVGEDALSHDLQVTLLYTRDPLVHHKASVRFYAEIIRQIRELPFALPELKVPTLILQAGADRVVSPQATERFFPLLGSTRKKLILYEGYYHEVLHEVDKERVFRDLSAWLKPIVADGV